MKPGRKPIEQKKCPVCRVVKPRSEYYKKGKTISHKCKPCSLADNKARSHKYCNKYSERVNDWRRNQVKNNPEYVERRKAQKRALWEKNKDKWNAQRRERYAKDPASAAIAARQRRNVKRATPPWADSSAIKEFYANCPAGHEVDHIIPILGVIDGRKVSGLHVPANLQYLTVRENRSKKNVVQPKDFLLIIS